MDEKLLCQIGLTANQARVYRLLVERKSLRPSQLVKIVHESRANCYALLDKLVDMGLARRIDVDKKLTYFPESPVVLEKILNEQIADAQGKLQAAQRALPRMLSVFNDSPEAPRVTQHKGKQALEEMYQTQLEAPDKDLHFIRSVHDVPFFGYDAMSGIRYRAAEYHKRRHGITPVVLYGKATQPKDARGNLRRTWLPKGSYTAPVEVAVTGDIMQFICFEGEGYGITIKNKAVAESMRQVMQLLTKYIRLDPDYQATPSEFRRLHERSTHAQQVAEAAAEAAKTTPRQKHQKRG